MNSQRSKIRKNKKGEDMLVDFWAILIFAFILLIFLILFLVDKRGDAPETTKDFESKDVSFMLNSFIRAPYNKDDTKTIGEIIAEDTMINDFVRTDEMFKSYFDDVDIYKTNKIIAYVIIIQEDSSTEYEKAWLVNPELYVQMMVMLKQVKVNNLLQNQMPGFVPTSNIYELAANEKIKTVSADATIPRSDNKDIKMRLGIIYYNDANNAFK